MFIMDDMVVVSPLVSIPPETEVPEWHGHGHGRGQWTWIMDMLKSWQSSHPSPTMQRLLWHVQWRVEEQVETREADQIPGPVDRLWPIFKLDKNQPSIHPSTTTHPSTTLHVTFCHTLIMLYFSQFNSDIYETLNLSSWGPNFSTQFVKIYVPP